MQEEKWKEIVGNIKDNFEVLDQGDDHLEDDGGTDIEFIEFNGPLGKIRLEYVSKPVVLDKKTNYSKRIGSETAVHYVYSETERNAKLDVYKLNEDSGEWEEFDASSLFS